MKQIGNFLKSIFSRATQKMGSLLFRNKERQNSDDSDMWQAPLPKPQRSEIFLRKAKVLFVFLLRVIIVGFVIYAGFMLYRFTAVRTGLVGKTLWDWLDLLIVPFFLAIIAFWFSKTQQKLDNKISDDRIESDREIERESQREATLKEYIEKIAQLLLDGKLDTSQVDSNARKIARIYTLTVLRNLDSKRIVMLIRFLYEAGLIIGENSVIDLTDAYLGQLDLSEYNFSNINLNGVKIERTKLHRTKLEGAYFCNAELSSCDLDNAQIISAQLIHTTIHGGRLAETNFNGAYLTHTKIYSAFMVEAAFRNANLSETEFISCDLLGAKFYDANLQNVELLNCNLEDAHFKGANIKRMSVNASKVTRDAFSPKQVDEVQGFE